MKLFISIFLLFQCACQGTLKENKSDVPEVKSGTFKLQEFVNNFPFNNWQNEALQSIKNNYLNKKSSLDSLMEEQSITTIKSLNKNYFTKYLNKMIPTALLDSSFSNCYLITFFKGGEIQSKHIAVCFKEKNNNVCVKHIVEAKDESTTIDYSEIDEKIINPETANGVYGDNLITISLIDEHLQVKKCNVITSPTNKYLESLNKFFYKKN